eukprot:m.254447 g.254447  ORF g.254447 m.254447 type:complete len:844 (+) comp40384_c0_seq11:225-2756(+)
MSAGFTDGKRQYIKIGVDAESKIGIPLNSSWVIDINIRESEYSSAMISFVFELFVPDIPHYRLLVVHKSNKCNGYELAWLKCQLMNCSAESFNDAKSAGNTSVCLDGYVPDNRLWVTFAHSESGVLSTFVNGSFVKTVKPSFGQSARLVLLGMPMGLETKGTHYRAISIFSFRGYSDPGLGKMYQGCQTIAKNLSCIGCQASYSCDSHSVTTPAIPSSSITPSTENLTSQYQSSVSKPTSSPPGQVENTNSQTLFIGVGVGAGAGSVLLLAVTIVTIYWCSSRKRKGIYHADSVNSNQAMELGPTYAEVKEPMKGADGYLVAAPSIKEASSPQFVRTHSGDYDYTYASIRRGRSREGSQNSDDYINGSSSASLCAIDRPRAKTPTPEPYAEIIEKEETFRTPESVRKKQSKDHQSENESAYSSDECNAASPTDHQYHELDYLPHTKDRTAGLATTNLNSAYIDAENVCNLESAHKHNSDSEVFWTPGGSVDDLYAQFEGNYFRIIDRKKIIFQEKLGAGEFGDVEKATWLVRKDKQLTVAVKKVNSSSKEEDRVKFLQEAAIMGQFVHQNVVALCGIVLSAKEVLKLGGSCVRPLIVLEYMPLGDLKSYLQKLRPESSGKPCGSEMQSRLLQMARDIATGMKYLAKKLFIHRDLAARNVLVSQTHTCKIGDFGLARDLSDEMYYLTNSKRIPIRWTAPEAVTSRKYSVASDVWSFGVVLYEIWSLGERPYGGWSNKTVIDWISAGCRLAPTPGLPRPIYTLMILCWHPDHHARPSFADIELRLSAPDSRLLNNAEGVEKPAGSLGGSLEESRFMYKDLQNSYRQEEMLLSSEDSKLNSDQVYN